MSYVRTDKYGAWPRTEDELLTVIRAALDFEGGGESGYEASANALVTVAVAAFNYAAHVVGASGFQGSWAGLQFLKQTRGMDGPFGILDGEHLLFPQYDLEEQARKWISEWRVALAPKAAELLADDGRVVSAAPAVVKRWREIASLSPSVAAPDKDALSSRDGEQA